MNRSGVFSKSTTIAVCVLPILMLMLCQPMFAQSARARILGTVTDPAGAVISSVSVTVTNVATGVGTKTTTDQAGRYQALELPIGSYNVKGQKDGFKTTETASFTLEVNHVLRLDLRLRVAGRNQAIRDTGQL